MRTASIYTLGCRLNQADSALVAGELSASGYEIMPWGKATDLVVINGCTVTGVASQKTRQAVRAARKRLPNAFIVLMGCEATVAKPDKYPEANLIVPNPRSDAIPNLIQAKIKQALPAKPVDDFTLDGVGLYEERTRANLKIQEGCDFYCTYCIVPHTRGPARSRDFDDVLREASALVARGHRELVLAGVNITTYSSHGADLADLIQALLAIDDGFRIRLGSAEPGPIVPKVVDLMASEPRLCSFLHLPLQYGEDGILAKMGRHYDTSEYASLVRGAFDKIPGLCLGTDVIVGFPGETEESFSSCRTYLESLPFGLMHIFTYSIRPGTPAATMPGRPTGDVSATRSATLLDLAQAKAEAFAKSQVGKRLVVLTEETDPVSGWSDNYLHVTLPGNALERNTLVTANIVEATGGRELIAQA